MILKLHIPNMNITASATSSEHHTTLCATLQVMHCLEGINGHLLTVIHSLIKLLSYENYTLHTVNVCQQYREGLELWNISPVDSLQFYFTHNLCMDYLKCRFFSFLQRDMWEYNKSLYSAWMCRQWVVWEFMKKPVSVLWIHHVLHWAPTKINRFSPV